MTICEHCQEIDCGSYKRMYEDGEHEHCVACDEMDTVSEIDYNDYLDGLESDEAEKFNDQDFIDNNFNEGE